MRREARSPGDNGQGRRVVGAAGPQIRPELVDRMIDLYCDWRSESAAVEAAYQRFSDAAGSERAVAFAAYMAALDREESACASYAEQIRVIESRCAGAGTRVRLQDIPRR